MFLKYLILRRVTTLIVYVDDQDNIGLRERLRSFMNFEVKRWKVEILSSNRHGLFKTRYLCKHKYVIDLLTEIEELGRKRIGTPIDQNHKSCTVKYNE